MGEVSVDLAAGVGSLQRRSKRNQSESFEVIFHLIYPSTDQQIISISCLNGIFCK